MQSQYINDKALGYQQITGLTTAQKLSIPLGTKTILIQPEAQGVRWRDDGIAPTATVGYPLGAGNELRYTGSFANMQTLQFIAQTAGAVLNVTYYIPGEF